MSDAGSRTASEAELDDPVSGEHARDAAERDEANEQPAAEAEAAAPEAVAFVEHDGPTRMDYDHGGVPKYVFAVWALSLLALVTYFVVNGIPDLSLWGTP